VYSDFAEHNRRSKNIIISGLSIASGHSGVNDKQRAENLLKDEFAMSVDIVKASFNSFTSIGQIPGAWKRAVVTQVFKKGSTTTLLILFQRRLTQRARRARGPEPQGPQTAHA